VVESLQRLQDFRTEPSSVDELTRQQRTVPEFQSEFIDNWTDAQRLHPSGLIGSRQSQDGNGP
jgi:hypothetical protein